MSGAKSVQSPQSSPVVAALCGQADQLIALIDRRAGDLDEGLRAALSAVRDEREDSPTVSVLLRQLGRATVTARDAMVEGDLVYRRHVAHGAALRAERDARGVDVAAALAAVGEIVSGVYGSAALPLVGLTTTPPREARALGAYARHAVEALRSPDALPAPRVDGAQVAFAAHAEGIATAADALDAALARVAADEVDVRATLERKTAALAAFRAQYAAAFRVVDGLVRLIDRGVPSARRPASDETSADDVSERDSSPGVPAGYFSARRSALPQ